MSGKEKKRVKPPSSLACRMTGRMAIKLASVSLRDQLMLLFAGAMFAGMTLLGTILFFNLYQNAEKGMTDHIDTTVSAITKSLEQSFLITENLVLELAASEGVRNWVKDETYYDRENPDFYIRKADLSREMQRVLVYSNAKKLNVIEYAVIYENGEPLEYTDIQAVGEAAILYESRKAYEAIAMHEYEYVYTQLIPGARDVIFHVRRVKSDFTGDSHLVLMIATNEKSIRECYSDLITDNESIVYLLNQERQIFSSSQADEIGQFQEDTVSWERDEFLITQEEMKEFEMRFVYLFPRKALTMQAFQGLKPYLLLSIGIIAVCVAMALALGIRSTQFLDEFVFALNSVREKNYDVQIRRYKNSEIDRMGEAFNEMTRELKELVQNKYESQLLLNEMEIRFLQHQMNPHFLFNVLLTIQIKAKRCRDETVYQMVSRLSALLRASIYTKDINKITVGEELEYVEFYLYLQKIRFEEKISYVITVEDEGIRECVIPKFIIEPIVENAVIHGIETIEELGEIQIDIRRAGKDLVIQVRDNGKGFDLRQYQMELEARREEGIGGGREKVGLKNVAKRIRHIYGEGYGVQVESEKNRGTLIEIRVPAEVKRECTTL